MASKKKERTSLSLTAITRHAYNGDRSKVAICNSTNDILVYSVEGTESVDWKLLETLKAHDMTVLGVDWAPKADSLVTSSEDRTTFVWTQKNGSYEPTMCVLTSNNCVYAPLATRWSPAEKKFAVGTGSGETHVCYYYESDDYWISKGAKGHKSSVTCVAWMPGQADLVMATGSTDHKLKIMSAYIKPCDGKIDNPGKPGTVLGEFTLGGWVHCVNFSQNGDWLCAVTHDSSITFVDTSGDEYDTVQTLRLKLLPFNSCVFVDDDKLIAAGHDNYPVMFTVAGGKWKLAGKWLGDGKKDAGEKKSTMGSRAMAMFQDQATFGQAKGKEAAKTKHTSAITDVQCIKYGKTFSFSTSGLDGQLNIWKSADMTEA
eukprot:TRINITY_DN14938_c0_g1_i1.p1 TRINITY_DN14938_c0_g1~~TRINITY_DN14938_c0_g1_i1.p1  ORF type:complete len:387 (+),score=140.35 TRINITY_DN14938_c0_g1_i1:48-1163(+)